MKKRVTRLGGLLAAYQRRDPAARSKLEIFLLYPGVHAVLYHRVAHWLYRHHRFFLARCVSQWSRFWTGIEIHPVRGTGRDGFIDVFRREPSGQQPREGCVQAAQPSGADPFPAAAPGHPRVKQEHSGCCRVPVHGFLQCRQIGITLWPQYPDETFGPKRAAQAIRAGHRLIPMQLDAIQTGGAGGFLDKTHVVGHEHAYAEHIPAVQRGGLFRRQQAAPPSAREGRGAEGQDVGGERLAERRFDLNGVEQGFALGRGQRPGFFLIPPYGADERQAPAARVGAGAGRHADVFREFGSHHNDFQMPQGILRHTYLEGPPQHKDPAKFITQVILPIV